MVTSEDAPARRLVELLDALAASARAQEPGPSVTALARELGRDKSSVSRQLRILADLGLVEKRDDGAHALGWRLFALAAQARDQRLLHVAPPIMRELVRATDERVHLSVRHQDEVLTIRTEAPGRSIAAAGWVGRTVPILSTASGRALMIDDDEAETRALVARAGADPGAGIGEALRRRDRARASGVSTSLGEFEEGLTAVAAPVRDEHGRIVAAINVSAPAHRIDARIPEVARLVRRTAAAIGRALTAAPAPGTGRDEEDDDV